MLHGDIMKNIRLCILWNNRDISPNGIWYLEIVLHGYTVYMQIWNKLHLKVVVHSTVVISYYQTYTVATHCTSNSDVVLEYSSGPEFLFSQLGLEPL